MLSAYEALDQNRDPARYGALQQHYDRAAADLGMAESQAAEHFDIEVCLSNHEIAFNHPSVCKS